MNLRAVLFFSALSLTYLVSCSTTPEHDTATPEGTFALAEKYVKDERFEEAIAQFQQVYNKYPYSRLAADARLRTGDVQFKREDYVDAQASYQSFKELHPTHAKIAYATFQLGLSIFMQIPESIDRDLSLSDKALLYFDEVITSFGSSEVVPKAKEYKGKLLRMLAEKELYIAEYYFKHEQFDSAMGRYEDLLRKYPDVGLDAKALLGANRCAREIKDGTKEKHYYDLLISKYADTDEAKTARGEK